jgi:polyhydroxybutyrate depolymerase
MLSRSVFVLLIAACGTTTPPITDRPKTFGGDRPVTLQVPTGFDEAKHYPLVVILHGYSASGFIQEAYFGLKALQTEGKAFVIAPDGLVDASGNEFWNADPACCDLGGLHPDDSGYIGKLIDDVNAAWPVSDVFLIGHSNGGYMSYRMACDRADAISAIVVLAGIATTTPCNPTREVSVLHIHGTADAAVSYTGGGIGGVGAVGSVMQWAQHDGCGTTRTAGAATFDYDNAVVGAETHTESTDGCPATGAVELWTLQGSSHVPSLTAAFEPAVWDWMSTHARPTMR